MTDLQNEIQRFLTGFSLEIPELPSLNKAGLIPYMAGNPRRYYVMKPTAGKPHLTPPEFQLCKGTRMYETKKGWRDMRSDVPPDAKLENIAVTALREAVEELGIQLSNICALKMLGKFSFTSATSGKDKSMFLLAAEMKNADDFLPAGAIEKTIAERTWLTLEEFRQLGRPDHYEVLEKIYKQIL